MCDSPPANGHGIGRNELPCLQPPATAASVSRGSSSSSWTPIFCNFSAEWDMQNVCQNKTPSWHHLRSKEIKHGPSILKGVACESYASSAANCRSNSACTNAPFWGIFAPPSMPPVCSATLHLQPILIFRDAIHVATGLQCFAMEHREKGSGRNESKIQFVYSICSN